MKSGLAIKPDGRLDLLSLGALVNRLDLRILPLRKANEFKIHLSGGEFDCATNLADCFGQNTAIATAMVDYSHRGPGRRTSSRNGGASIF